MLFLLHGKHVYVLLLRKYLAVKLTFFMSVSVLFYLFNILTNLLWSFQNISKYNKLMFLEVWEVGSFSLTEEFDSSEEDREHEVLDKMVPSWNRTSGVEVICPLSFG